MQPSRQQPTWLAESPKSSINGEAYPVPGFAAAATLTQACKPEGPRRLFVIKNAAGLLCGGLQKRGCGGGLIAVSGRKRLHLLGKHCPRFGGQLKQRLALDVFCIVGKFPALLRIASIFVGF